MTSRRSLALALALCLPPLAACSTTIDADDYDRSCNDAAECRVILVGDVCDCSCDASAINAADYDRYLEDRGEVSCNKDCGPCQSFAAACADHVCVAVAE